MNLELQCSVTQQRGPKGCEIVAAPETEKLICRHPEWELESAIERTVALFRRAKPLTRLPEVFAPLIC
jgi:hypothetical protein